ncbi:MAG: hypothetical protein ACR2HF_05545 [Methylococcaceae bacterium]
MSIPSRLLYALLVLFSISSVWADAPNEAWQGTSLSDETLQKVQRTLVDYQQCITEQTQGHINDRLDSRAITDLVLKKCEERLAGIKTAFDGEKVPVEISERYMRSRRTHAARNILKAVMSVQALRSSTEKP